ncbi:MAG: hypothetical protein U0599_15325 [Vicinamibacteria bacterium]
MERLRLPAKVEQHHGPLGSGLRDRDPEGREAAARTMVPVDVFIPPPVATVARSSSRGTCRRSPAPDGGARSVESPAPCGLAAHGLAPRRRGKAATVDAIAASPGPPRRPPAPGEPGSVHRGRALARPRAAHQQEERQQGDEEEAEEAEDVGERQHRGLPRDHSGGRRLLLRGRYRVGPAREEAGLHLLRRPRADGRAVGVDVGGEDAHVRLLLARGRSVVAMAIPRLPPMFRIGVEDAGGVAHLLARDRAMVIVVSGTRAAARGPSPG